MVHPCLYKCGAVALTSREEAKILSIKPSAERHWMQHTYSITYCNTTIYQHTLSSRRRFFYFAVALANKHNLESGVEVGWLSAKRVEDVRLAVDLFVNHESQDSHLCGSAVVQFDGSLLEHFFLRCLPREHAVSEITGVFSHSSVLHDEQLEESDKGENLEKTLVGDVFDSGDAGLDGGKGGSGVVDVSGNTGTEGCVDVSENGKHGNASVLDFDVTKTVESVLVDTVEHVQRIPESQRLLGSDFGVEGR
mmetsp:Transcript_17466/g.35902  ORF Transcript_17466/g.35902 Transcript_17466/m.35902 type:complete len:250 (-) Transcript_17466:271-1020(-)